MRWLGWRPTVPGVAMNRSIIRTAAARAAPRAVAIGHPLGQADQGRPHAQQAQEQCADRALAPPGQEEEGLSHVALGVEGAVRRRLPADQGGEGAAVEPERDHQDLVATLDHRAEFVGLTFAVHNGHKFLPMYVTENMVGTSSESSRRRTYHGHGADKKARRR